MYNSNILVRIILVTTVLEFNRLFILYYSVNRSAPIVIKVTIVALNIPNNVRRYVRIYVYTANNYIFIGEIYFSGT